MSLFATGHQYASCLSENLPRYIEQPQALLTSSESSADKKDRDKYAAGVQLAQGIIPESMYSDVPDKVYLAYVHSGTAAGVLGIQPDLPTPAAVVGNRAEGHPAFSYERWVASGTQRKVTGDFLLGHHSSG